MAVKNNPRPPQAPKPPQPPKNDPKKDPPKNDPKKDQPKTSDPKKPPQPEILYNRPADPKTKKDEKKDDKKDDKADEKKNEKKDEKKDDKKSEKKDEKKAAPEAAPADGGAPAGGEAAPAGGDGPASAGPTSYVSPDGTLTINPGDVMTLEMAQKIAADSGGAYVVKDGALVNTKDPSDMKPIGQAITEGDIHDLHHNVMGAGGGGNSLNPSGVPDASKAGAPAAAHH